MATSTFEPEGLKSIRGADVIVEQNMDSFEHKPSYSPCAARAPLETDGSWKDWIFPVKSCPDDGACVDVSNECEVARDDWVVLSAPTPEDQRDMQLLTTTHDAPQGLSTAAATAAVGGIVGLVLVGPVAGAVVAAGSVSAVVDSEGLSLVAKNAANWVKRSSPGRFVKCAETAEALASKAKDALCEARQASAKLAPGIASLYSAVSGAALAERDELIEQLKTELDKSCQDAEREKESLTQAISDAEQSRIETAERLCLEMQTLEERWKAQNVHLNSQLETAKLESVEEQTKMQHELATALKSKDEEVNRLTRELQTTSKVWEQDIAKLTCELDHHRRERLEDCKRLTAEMAETQKLRETFNYLQTQLADTERAQLRANEEAHQKNKELQIAVLQNEKDTEAKLCCVCLEAERKVLFLPCKHICCCASCADKLTQCPIDRCNIDHRVDFIVA